MSSWNHPSWRHFRFALCAFVVWRVALVVVSLVGYHLLPHDTGHSEIQPSPFGHDAWLNGWVRWDARHYQEIAAQGYNAGGISPAFFPLFPLLSRALSWFVGDRWIALLITANLSFAFAIWVFYRLALLKLDEAGARRAVIFLLLFPGSFFFGAAYSESTYLLCLAASFWCYERDNLPAAGVLGAAAALARSTGVLLLPALALGILLERAPYGFRHRLRRLLWLLPTPLGLFAFMLLLRIQTGSFTETFAAQARWGRVFSWPWQTLSSEARHVDWTFTERHGGKTVTLLNLGFLLGAAFLTPAILRRLGWAHFAFTWLVLLTFLSTSCVESGMRIVMTIPALTLTLAATAKDRQAERWAMFALALALGLLTTRFVNGYWMT